MLRALPFTLRTLNQQTRPAFSVFSRNLSEYSDSWTTHTKAKEWVERQIQHCTPDKVFVCDGSQEEFDQITKQLCDEGRLIPLSKREGSFYARSDPTDVARVEKQTYICSEKEEDAGPINNWMPPAEARKELDQLFKGCMKGRNMYVVPFSMGPVGGPASFAGIELTDSPFVVANMRIMTRVGTPVVDVLNKGGEFVPGLHSVGQPLKEGESDSNWPCNSTKRIVHFPETREIVSFGSGYGGNALLGKKCFALRIASAMARDQGWLAEHMLILGLTNPAGEKKYIAAAFPSACGKTNLAMLNPTIPGWKIETVGDDIAWMYVDKEGQLRAINPENGFFGVAPGTWYDSNPNAMDTIRTNTLFTNVALVNDGEDVWWEGMPLPENAKITDWLGNPWDPSSSEKAAHPNSRFTTPAAQCPTISSEWEAPEGVPISAILFGGRRAHTVPLVHEAFDWDHGVYMGSSVSSEQTAAAEGVVGSLRHDPFAMSPFCGYNMADYFGHWLSMGEKIKKQPKFFYVNWFRKSEEGKFLWPGFGENSRVLEWIFNRSSPTPPADSAAETPIGLVPPQGAINTEGLSITDDEYAQLTSIDKKSWLSDTQLNKGFFEQFGNKFPSGLTAQIEKLEKRLQN